MAYVYKQINKNEITITPFQVHKTFSATNNNASSSGVNTYQAIYNPDHVELSSDNPATTAEGTSYKFIAHASIYHMYYEDFDIRPMETMDYYHSNEKRTLHEKATIFSIPQNVYAQRLKSGLTTLTVAGREVAEDDYGNLYDVTRKSLVGSLVEDTNNYLISRIDFNETYRYGSKTISTGSLKQYPFNPFQPSFRDMKFTDGTYGKQGSFQGSGSQVVIPHDEKFDFNPTQDFFISMMLDIPVSQTYLTNQTNTIIKNGSSGPYPFALEVYNSGAGAGEGKLLFSRYDGQQLSYIISSASINDGIARHIGLRKSGSTMELWIDGTKDDSTTITSGDTLNTDNIYVGENLLGEIDQLKIFNNSFTETEVGNYGTWESGSNLNYNVGNVFPETGMVVITSPYQEFADLTTDTGSFTFGCRGTRDIEEYEILCQVEGNEFNYTVNPSAATKDRNGHFVYNDIIRNDTFSPYVTQIGLYNDIGELLLISKLSQPVKIPNGTDITFVVKFDV